MTMEYEIEKTEAFDKCLKSFKDRKAVLVITQRLNRAALGNFSDLKPLEMRFMKCGFSSA